MSDRIVRKLVAIVSTDIVGYSRLMGADETGTLARMKAHRQELWSPVIEKHGGRLVGTAGDSLLIEYASAVAAVESAIEVQQGMAKREAGRPEDRRMLLRVGINIGEVVVDGDDIFGDGVNVAARLQALADPGGISISAKVHDEVVGKLTAGFADQGECAVKNIARPIRVWRWTGGAAAPSAAPAEQALALPDRPSIAVLPFDNMSGDPEQEFFADGIAEDITTELARVRELFVIARNSSFSYRGQSVDVRRVGNELGVRYVLEGSVRRGGNRVRITAQLIEARTGNHVWAERYDRPLDDIFAIQDEITANVVGAVDSEIRATEMNHVARKRLADLGAYERVLKAFWHISQTTEEGNAAAAGICREELVRDGENHRALIALALCRALDSLYGWGASTRQESVREAANAAKAAIVLDSNEEWAHGIFAMVLWFSGQHAAAIREAEVSIELNPNYNLGHAILGYALGYSGAEHHQRAIDSIAYAIRLGPRDPWVAWAHAHSAMIELIAGHHDAAVDCARKALGRDRSLGLAHRALAAGLAFTGDLVGARAAWEEGIRVQPIDVEAYGKSSRSLFKKQADFDRYFEGLRLASTP